MRTLLYFIFNCPVVLENEEFMNLINNGEEWILHALISP
jgi:hypothetical protein